MAATPKPPPVHPGKAPRLGMRNWFNPTAKASYTTALVDYNTKLTTYNDYHNELKIKGLDKLADNFRDATESEVGLLRAKAENKMGLAAAKGELKAAQKAYEPYTVLGKAKEYGGWAKNKITGTTAKYFKRAGIFAGIIGGLGALALFSNSSHNARKYKPGDEDISANANLPPLMTPDMMAMEAPIEMAQPQGRKVLGPMTARVLGAEAGGPNQPRTPNVDGKDVANLGSMPAGLI